MKISVTGPIDFDNDDDVAEDVSRAVAKAGALRFRHVSTERGRLTGTVESISLFKSKHLARAQNYVGKKYSLTELGSSADL